VEAQSSPVEETARRSAGEGAGVVRGPLSSARWLCGFGGRAVAMEERVAERWSSGEAEGEAVEAVGAK